MSRDMQLKFHRGLHEVAQPVGQLLTDVFHYIGLFAIGAATVWSAGAFFIELMGKSHASVEDLLLLFIYLEIGSMVGIYFKTNHMPLRFLIYVGITALTRHLIGWVNHKPEPDMGILILAAGTLVLALSVLVIRYASFHYPASDRQASDRSQLTDSDPGFEQR